MTHTMFIAWNAFILLNGEYGFGHDCNIYYTVIAQEV